MEGWWVQWRRGVDGMCKVVTHKTYNKIQNIETEIWYNCILLTDVYNDNMIVQNKVNNGAFKTNTLLSYYSRTTVTMTIGKSA